MARTSVTAQTITTGGVAPSLTAPTGEGDTFTAGRVLLYVKNADDDTAVTVTIPTPATVGGLAITDAGGSVPFGTFKLFGPFPRSLFGQPEGDADAGKVHVDYSTTTGITRALITI